MFYTLLTGRDLALTADGVTEMLGVVNRWHEAGCDRMPDGRAINPLIDELGARQAELEAVERRATLEADGTPHCGECLAVDGLVPSGTYVGGDVALVCGRCRASAERDADRAGDWATDAEAHYRATRGCYTV